jgi:hypothetical protein
MERFRNVLSSADRSPDKAKHQHRNETVIDSHNSPYGPFVVLLLGKVSEPGTNSPTSVTPPVGGGPTLRKLYATPWNPCFALIIRGS